MWVCGVIGYAQITCGRHSATASATAREPSICLSMRRSARLASPWRTPLPPRATLGSAMRSGNFSRMAAIDRLEPDEAGERGEAASSGDVGHRASDVLLRELGRRAACTCAIARAAHESASPSVVDAARRVDEHDAVAAAGR